MTAEDEPAKWTSYFPETETAPEYWTVTRAVRLHLPGWDLLERQGYGWRTGPAWIDLDAGFRFAPSWPAIEDPSAIVAAAVHDIICTPLRRESGAGARFIEYPLPSYTARHWLYASILRAQREDMIRCAWCFVGLWAANWIHALGLGPETPAPPRHD
jgi:hypothetical protein